MPSFNCDLPEHMTCKGQVTFASPPNYVDTCGINNVHIHTSTVNPEGLIQSDYSAKVYNV